jgi:type VI secretion system secreted protein Hcp
MSSVDCFLHIVPYSGGSAIIGESQDKEFPGDIEVLSWSGEFKQQGSIPYGQGTGAGKIVFEDFRITKRIDKSSPVLFNFVCSGTPFETVTLSLRKAGNGQKKYLSYEFKLVLITSIQPHLLGSFPPKVDDNILPMETICLQYGGLVIHYTPQQADGSLGAKITGGWSVKENKKL